MDQEAFDRPVCRRLEALPASEPTDDLLVAFLGQSGTLMNEHDRHRYLLTIVNGARLRGHTAPCNPSSDESEREPSRWTAPLVHETPQHGQVARLNRPVPMGPFGGIPSRADPGGLAVSDDAGFGDHAGGRDLGDVAGLRAGEPERAVGGGGDVLRQAPAASGKIVTSFVAGSRRPTASLNCRRRARRSRGCRRIGMSGRTKGPCERETRRGGASPSAFLRKGVVPVEELRRVRDGGTARAVPRSLTRRKRVAAT